MAVIDAYSAGFAAGHDEGKEYADKLLQEIRHLPVGEQRRIINAKQAELEAKLRKTDPRYFHLKSMKDDADFAKDTLERWDRGEYALQRLPHSMMHKMLAAIDEDRIEWGVVGHDEEFRRDFKPRVQRCVPFVLEHDWASAFAKAQDFDDGDYRLPFDDTVFEMRADGRHVAAFCTADGVRLLAIQLGDGWFVSRWDGKFGAAHWMPSIIRAACIALDAEVAVAEAIRAPDKLNASRARKGKLPLLDYHVVRVSHRARPAPLDEHGETGRHMRLHFVRGHWRHYEAHKTWIKWHLRGDPDLGFIDKHYRL